MTFNNKVTICTIIVSVFFIINTIPSSALADVPEHTVYRTTGKIVLDGIIDEADWAAAEPVGEFVFPWWTEGEKEQTEVKMPIRIHGHIRMTRWNSSGIPILRRAISIISMK